MGKIKVTPCDIDGLYVIEPKVFGDERGYFVETYNKQEFAANGLDMEFVQDNQSKSKKECCVDCIFRSNIHRGSLSGYCPGRCLMWQWISGRARILMENGLE